MKISYERLNQIIEEEVVRFKKLNEAEGIGGGVQAQIGTIDYAKIQAKKGIDAASDGAAMIAAVQAAVKGIK